MAHAIKYNRAKRLAHVGQYHQTYAAVWGAIPAEAKDALTSRALAELADAMRLSYNRGGTAAYRELYDEGAIRA